MKFFRRSTCKLLEEMGCVATSGLYFKFSHGEWKIVKAKNPEKYFQHLNATWVFGLWDLCGPSERARENARIAFKDAPLPTDEGNLNEFRHIRWRVHRHRFIDLPEDEVESYVVRSLKGIDQV